MTEQSGTPLIALGVGQSRDHQVCSDSTGFEQYHKKVVPQRGEKTSKQLSHLVTSRAILGGSNLEMLGRSQSEECLLESPIWGHIAIRNIGSGRSMTEKLSRDANGVSRVDISNQCSFLCLWLGIPAISYQFLFSQFGGRGEKAIQRFCFDQIPHYSPFALFGVGHLFSLC